MINDLRTTDCSIDSDISLDCLVIEKGRSVKCSGSALCVIILFQIDIFPAYDIINVLHDVTTASLPIRHILVFLNRWDYLFICITQLGRRRKSHGGNRYSVIVRSTTQRNSGPRVALDTWHGQQNQDRIFGCGT